MFLKCNTHITWFSLCSINISSKNLDFFFFLMCITSQQGCQTHVGPGPTCLTSMLYGDSKYISCVYTTKHDKFEWSICPQVHWKTWRSCTSMTTQTCIAYHSSWPFAASCPSWASKTVPSATCPRRLSRGAPPSLYSSSRCRDHIVPWFEWKEAQYQSNLNPSTSETLHVCCVASSCKVQRLATG